MSYATVEAGLLTIVRLLSGYNATNTSQGDYRILAKGVAKAVILIPGPFNRSVEAAPRRLRQAWTIEMEIFIPWTDQISTISAAVKTVRQEVMDQVDKYPTLNSTSGVINAFIEGGNQPELWRGENRRWWVQTLRCMVEERSSVVIAE